ncbi:DEAD/DEAH box helicase [Acinetobacter sp. MD2(2019)]|uniref:DEAD/DEAH box helicase n=1 Tax=Acinetobacter sp. MD2(2019) TaxID=2605273 RepID=UPI002D1F04B7|nr:DEAD/DEAH box helicase [Acinetobacter sp. MD2(2019)]MEB3754565.1 DEAD/DEAH box helicase [Acinetobacter sp. MD2(2019)]
MLSSVQFFSRFSAVTLQRSMSYVKKIDLNTLEINHVGNEIEIHAQISGTNVYESAIYYNVKKQKIIETDCSCPVGFNCKHTAALAQLFYNQYLDKPSASPIKDTPERNENQVNFWLNQVKNTLDNIEPTPINELEHAHQFIYVLQQKQALSCDVLKVRRLRSGEIRDAKTYTMFENILEHRIQIPQAERQLFQRLYYHSQIQQKNSVYRPELTLPQLPLELLQQLIASEDCFWHSYRTAPLTWSNELYQLDLQWEENPRTLYEKLVIDLIQPNGRKSTLTADAQDFKILYTKPIVVINVQHSTVHSLEQQYPGEFIHQILNMPEIPKDVMLKVNQTFEKYQITKSLPKAESVKNLTQLHGQPKPILRFGGLISSTLAKATQTLGVGLAEIYFEYAGGVCPANSEQAFFYGKQKNKAVCQNRDIAQEQKYYQQLQKLVPSLTWLKDLEDLSHVSQQHQAVVCAKDNEWIQSLLPTNQIEQLGWQVEHLADSPFFLQQAQNIRLSLNESEYQQDWFNVGASIEDSQGNRYDLIEMLANLVQRHPFIVEPEALDDLDDLGFFTIKIGKGQPDLVLNVKDIKPILRYLGNILQQDSTSVDRYDAAQLIELQHHLGMPWQTNSRLKKFAAQLKTSYQQQLATPKNFQGELRAYQQQGLGWLQFLCQTEHGGILADDMGLGKTAQTLAHLLMEKQAGHLDGTPALIIAPTSLMHNWFKEAEKFTPDLKVLILQGANRHQHFQKLKNYDIVLSTYPLLARDEEHLLQHQFHQLILDEAQTIKNPNAKAAQVARQIKAKHRLCLTGTPMENHLGELWSLFYFLMPGFLSTQQLFNKNYRHPIEKHGDQHAREKLINRIKPFILRRLKTEVAKELPAKTTIEVNIDMNEQQSKIYEAVRATMQTNIRQIIAEKGFNRSQIQILDALLKLRQVCCHPILLKLDSIKASQAQSAKLDHLLEMVTSMVEEGRKILIFSQFTSMLQLIEQSLTTQGIKHVKLTGQTKKRDEVIQAFQDGQVPVFLISLKAGGVGLNLTAADTVIHYDPWWNPAAEDQASDRAWRIGQDKPVFVYKLITNQSIEEKILALQKNKAQLANSVLSTDHEGQVKITENDLMKLFEGF